MATVRAVTVLSGLRVVLTLDQLAAYSGVPLSSLDAGLRNGPAACSEVERVVQGSYVGYRHPDAAWTLLPSRLGATQAGVEFARWFAEWLETVDEQEREAARATAHSIAAVARVTGKIPLALRIEDAYRRGRRKAPFARAGSA